MLGAVHFKAKIQNSSGFLWCVFTFFMSFGGFLSDPPLVCKQMRMTKKYGILFKIVGLLLVEI